MRRLNVKHENTIKYKCRGLQMAEYDTSTEQVLGCEDLGEAPILPRTLKTHLSLPCRPAPYCICNHEKQTLELLG